MISLQVAYDAQERLNAAQIPSVVTGVWALNYHGVDVVMYVSTPNQIVYIHTEHAAGLRALYAIQFCGSGSPNSRGS